MRDMECYRCTDCKNIFDNNGLNACKWLREKSRDKNIKELAKWWNNTYKFEKGAEKYCKGFAKIQKEDDEV